MNFWDQYNSWEEAENEWDNGAERSAQQTPMKKLRVLPQMPGITAETAKGLKWKSLKYLVSHDNEGEIRRGFLKHPLRYGARYLNSLVKKKSYKRDGDFFLYGLSSVEDFEAKVIQQNSLLIAGFSYCQKPHECPSGRFTDSCIRDPEHPVCRQCDIGKVLHALPQQRVVPLLIPTVHYIGGKIFEIVQNNPEKEVIFLITACEMTLEMFGDWGNMTGVTGIGVRLDGRICNTMKAFKLSEKGVKPGLTVTTPETQSRILRLVKNLRFRAFA
jgi:hypothetical protein